MLLGGAWAGRQKTGQAAPRLRDVGLRTDPSELGRTGRPVMISILETGRRQTDL